MPAQGNSNYLLYVWILLSQVRTKSGEVIGLNSDSSQQHATPISKNRMETQSCRRARPSTATSLAEKHDQNDSITGHGFQNRNTIYEASPIFPLCLAVGPGNCTAQAHGLSHAHVFPHAPTLAHRGACHRKAKDGICTRPAVHTLGSRPKCVGWCRAWHHVPSPQQSARWYHPTVSAAVSAPRRPQRQAWHDNMTNWPKNEHIWPPICPELTCQRRLAPKKSGRHQGARAGAVN